MINSSCICSAVREYPGHHPECPCYRKTDITRADIPPELVAEIQAEVLVNAAKALQPKYEEGKGIPETAVWLLNDIATKLREKVK